MSPTKYIRHLFKRKSARKRIFRYGLILANLLVVAVVFSFFFSSSDNSGTRVNATASLITVADSSTTSPLDSLSSAQIAATAAKLANMPETVAIVNQADSDQARIHMIATSNNLISKPQVVSSDFVSNKDIKTYTVKSGDTLQSVAQAFNLTENTLRWSNSLTSNTLSAGQTLLIPPINGLVYTVKTGDTPQSLATKYGSNEANIVAYNDAEISGLRVGEKILIPGGTEPTVGPVIAPYLLGSFAYSPQYGNNGYDFGYCTWYVASRLPVPSNWGNASTWAYYASRTPGWNVSSVPTVGSIAQRSWGFGGAGHVGIVDAVNGNMIQVTDMNGVAGWDQVGTAWMPVSQFENFITH